MNRYRKNPSVAEHAGRKLKAFAGVSSEQREARKAMRIARREMRETFTDSDNMDEDMEEYMDEDMEEGFSGSNSDWILGTIFVTLVIFVLSPGVFLTLPPVRGRIWMSGQTSCVSAFVHALLIALLFNFF